jgi:hypothetical protein
MDKLIARFAHFKMYWYLLSSRVLGIGSIRSIDVGIVKISFEMPLHSKVSPVYIHLS